MDRKILIHVQPSYLDVSENVKRKEQNAPYHEEDAL